jgi:glutamate/aspartate transport system substrate-binding protein
MEDDILVAGFRANAKNPGDFKLLAKFYPSDPYALMIRKDDRQFRTLVDETLAKLMRLGEFEKLLRSMVRDTNPAQGHQCPIADVG